MIRPALLAAPAFAWLAFLAVLIPAPGAHAHWAVLRESTPPWGALDRHQGRLSRAEFEERLPLYSPSGAIHEYLELDDAGVTVHADTSRTRPLWRLRWAPPDRPAPRPPSWCTLTPLTGASPERPLAGLTIALDPGHIGGEWAALEERNLRVGSHPPIREGDMVLAVSRHLEPQLTRAGARVIWARSDAEPVTPLRPADLAPDALEAMATLEPRALARLTNAKLLRAFELRSNMLFYRGAEISARAARINPLRPDLTLCIHYNAAPNGRSRRIRLFNANKLVVFVHGAYTPGELADEVQRYHLFRKLLEGSASTELAVAEAISNSMRDGWGFPPENYDSWNVAAKAGDNPYVWARNLLANRLFDGPVIFVEGPYMNDRTMFRRMVAGDYEGEKEIGGKVVRSLHREFADFIAAGVISHYRRKLEPGD